MDVERIIDEIEQLQEMFEAPDIRPLSASDMAPRIVKQLPLTHTLSRQQLLCHVGREVIALRLESEMWGLLCRTKNSMFVSH